MMNFDDRSGNKLYTCKALAANGARRSADDDRDSYNLKSADKITENDVLAHKKDLSK